MYVIPGVYKVPVEWRTSPSTAGGDSGEAEKGSGGGGIRAGEASWVRGKRRQRHADSGGGGAWGQGNIPHVERRNVGR